MFFFSGRRGGEQQLGVVEEVEANRGGRCDDEDADR